jgi:hypothetical protein
MALLSLIAASCGASEDHAQPQAFESPTGDIVYEAERGIWADVYEVKSASFRRQVKGALYEPTETAGPLISCSSKGVSCYRSGLR